MKKFLLLVAFFQSVSFAAVDKIRVVWEENPDSEAIIVWHQKSGKNATLHYDFFDHKDDAAAYKNSLKAQRVEEYAGMKTHYLNLDKLKSDTNYYFLLKDSEGQTERYYFRTAPDKPKAFRFIQGGDSRNNHKARQEGNRLVAKLRPLFVSFGGDMTNRGKDEEWQAWLDDWELTYGEDGRIFPIVPTHGNHERQGYIQGIYGTKNRLTYYHCRLGGDLFSLFVLNSEIDAKGGQREYLLKELQKPKAKYRLASYHKPMRPHTKKKKEAKHLYDAWANIFYVNQFDVLCENDSHVVKRTVPVKPSQEEGSDEGFIADPKGYVKIGEGCWGAPVRKPDDAKSWTIDLGSFNSFDMLDVSEKEITIRTIKFEGQPKVAALKEGDEVFALPKNLNIWQAKGGAEQVIKARK